MFTPATPDPIALNAGLRPQSEAAHDLASGRRWTYRALDADIDRAVGVMHAKGVRKGQRVAALAGNSVPLMILQHALMRMEAVFVPLNWRLSLPELAVLTADCQPVLLVADREVPTLPSDCAVLSMAEFNSEIQSAEPLRLGQRHDANATCVILYTSGTSGVPKGAMLTSSTMLATALNSAILINVDERSSFLCDSPMFHVIGLVTQLWTPLTMGGCVRISDGFTPARTNARISDPELALTHYFCVPQMAESLRHDACFRPQAWQSLRAIFTGGAPNPPHRIREWLKMGIRMVDGYGMTETGTLLGMPLDRDLIADKAGAVGLPGPLTAVRLVDRQGAEVEPGTPGEIEVRGPNVISGYWNRPEDSAAAFADGGWFRTGDIGRRDADGFISIVDRSKDMFISGGENVYPAEVEAALIEHPQVREAAVLGMQDDKWGEVGCAFIVPTIPGGVPDAELEHHCGERIARYKIPKRFVMCDTLPRTGSGKVQKHILAKNLT